MDFNMNRINQIIQDISKTESFENAMTHKSYLKLDTSSKSYETLEYLGDSILQLYVTIFLYNCYPYYSEGKLNEERTLLTQGSYLSSISLRIGLYKYLKLDKKVTFTD